MVIGLGTNVILNTGNKESVNRHLKSKIFQPPKTCPGSIMYEYIFFKNMIFLWTFENRN